MAAAERTPLRWSSGPEPRRARRSRWAWAAVPAAALPAPLSGLALFFLFSIWILLNLGVLMVMENLSSFLHALRLQWVEFQNKFFYGDGNKYSPFSYTSITSVEAAAATSCCKASSASFRRSTRCRAQARRCGSRCRATRLSTYARSRARCATIESKGSFSASW